MQTFIIKCTAAAMGGRAVRVIMEGEGGCKVLRWSYIGCHKEGCTAALLYLSSSGR